MSYIRSNISHTPLTHHDFSDGVGEWAHDSDQRQWDALGQYDGPSMYDWRTALAVAEAEDAAELADRIQTNIRQRMAEAEAEDADEIGRQSSSLSFDLSDPRALLILDEARAILACLQSDGDTVGTLTITAIPYADGSTEYVTTVRP